MGTPSPRAKAPFGILGIARLSGLGFRVLRALGGIPLRAELLHFNKLFEIRMIPYRTDSVHFFVLLNRRAKDKNRKEYSTAVESLSLK